MKSKNMPRLINQQDNIKTLILHFNIDKTIIMRDSLSYDNSEVIVSISYLIKIWNNFSIKDKRSFIRINMGKRRKR